MQYYLNQTQIHQMEVHLFNIEKYYSENDASILKIIIQKAIISKYLDETDIYRLLDVLPRILPQSIDDLQIIQEESDNNWNEYIDEHRAKYKREMEKLYQALSSWIFMQKAVYQRNTKSLKGLVDRVKSKGDKQGIKK